MTLRIGPRIDAAIQGILVTSSEPSETPTAERRDKRVRNRRGRDKPRNVAAQYNQGRMRTLQVLYEVDLTDHDTAEAMARAITELREELDAQLPAHLQEELDAARAASGDAPLKPGLAAALEEQFNRVIPDSIAMVETLVPGVLERRDDLDAVIEEVAPARSMAEQSPIERNILRLAAYELLFVPRASPGASINEAVELAKRFGGPNSGAFVNGVLATVLERRPTDPGWKKPRTRLSSS